MAPQQQNVAKQAEAVAVEVSVLDRAISDCSRDLERLLKELLQSADAIQHLAGELSVQKGEGK
ncbi:hypothetical protein MD588_03500 [Photobacterium sp. SDRW27]|nr:hypothetical protein [Photobacterium obscurum]